jgi:hypothetical protein
VAHSDTCHLFGGMPQREPRVRDVATMHRAPPPLTPRVLLSAACPASSRVMVTEPRLNALGFPPFALLHSLPRLGTLRWPLPRRPPWPTEQSSCPHQHFRWRFSRRPNRARHRARHASLPLSRVLATANFHWWSPPPARPYRHGRPHVAKPSWVALS